MTTRWSVERFLRARYVPQRKIEGSLKLNLTVRLLNEKWALHQFEKEKRGEKLAALPVLMNDAVSAKC